MRNAIYLLVLASMLASCMTEKKWAEGCAVRFPVKDSVYTVVGQVKFDTTYLQPDTLVFTDTVTVDCDTVSGVVTKYIYKERACPPSQILTAIRVDTVIKTVVNRAEVAMQTERAAKAEAKVDRLVTGRNTWRWIVIVCFLVIGTAVFSKIKGFI